MDINLQNKLDENFNLFFPKHTDTTQNRAISVKNADKSLVNNYKQNTCALVANHNIGKE
jgi:hypothetical protein